jgi:hypothetical protein
MAATFTTTATNLEGQALEIAARLQLGEQTYNTANPDTPVNRVTISPSIETGEVSITINLPAALTNAGGAITQTATAYLP